MIKMLIDGRDRNFKIVGNENILKYLDYPLEMDIEDAVDRLEEENDGMDFYHIVDANVDDILLLPTKEIIKFVEEADAWDEYGVIEAMEALCGWLKIETDGKSNDEVLAEIKEKIG